MDAPTSSDNKTSPEIGSSTKSDQTSGKSSSLVHFSTGDETIGETNDDENDSNNSESKKQNLSIETERLKESQKEMEERELAFFRRFGEFLEEKELAMKREREADERFQSETIKFNEMNTIANSEIERKKSELIIREGELKDVQRQQQKREKQIRNSRKKLRKEKENFNQIQDEFAESVKKVKEEQEEHEERMKFY